ncbi:MAG TPA: GIY-YIG nuclease family protein [Candidatus Sulfotelmatobacter sp.]|jgi:predicted GIY-YIG superfamily endonuclease|nr:GIY-YIG nuclease family protein [Candidatus Sulfotelmatobacter sp.]
MNVKNHQYFVYIMSSHSGTLYIGMTNSIYRRARNTKADKSTASPRSTVAPAWSTTKASTTFTSPSDERKN